MNCLQSNHHIIMLYGIITHNLYELKKCLKSTLKTIIGTRIKTKMNLCINIPI